MRIISRKTLRNFWERYSDSEEALKRWYEVTRKARWSSLPEVRQDFPTADSLKLSNGKIVTIFNVAGNKYRLVSAIHYDKQKVFTLQILTHQEYDKERWKEQLSYVQRHKS
ncbi:MAG: mRNA interferase toxin HigB [bacterium]|nr:mRNA interferase toxin HigB [bacterium]